eukprot:1295884-Prymnesium_polylepis.2
MARTSTTESPTIGCPMANTRRHHVCLPPRVAVATAIHTVVLPKLLPIDCQSTANRLPIDCQSTGSSCKN